MLECRVWVDCCLLEKSNIRNACKTCSGEKPAIRDSERSVPLAQPGTATYGQNRTFPKIENPASAGLSNGVYVH